MRSVGCVQCGFHAARRHARAPGRHLELNPGIVCDGVGRALSAHVGSDALACTLLVQTCSAHNAFASPQTVRSVWGLQTPPRTQLGAF